jgi:hypothetical protein
MSSTQISQDKHAAAALIGALEAPAEKRSPGFQARKGQRGFKPITFLGSLRGDGLLVSNLGEVPVAYQLDLYEGTAGRTGSGALDGKVSVVGGEGAGPVRLRLDSGAEIGITLQDIDDTGAVFDSRGVLAAVKP